MPNLFYAGQTDYIQKLNTLATSTSLTDGSVAASFLSLVVAGAATIRGVHTVNLNAASLPTALTGTVLHLGQTNGTVSRFLVDSFAANGGVSFRRANGTAASPSALLADQSICAFFGFGYGATGYSASGRAGFSIFAAENWTDSAQGAYIEFSSTPLGGTTSVGRLRVQPDGRVCTVNKLSPGTDAGAYQTACGFYAGTGAPNNANGTDGDFYFRGDGGSMTTVYQRRSGAWTGLI